MPHLHGEHVFLREYREEDFIAIRGWINDPEVTGHLSPLFDTVQTEAMTRSFFDKVSKNELPGHYFIIADKMTGAYLGQVDLRTNNDPSRQAGLAIVIPERKHRGKGYGREAMTLLLDFAFARLNLHKVWLHVLTANEPAIKLYEALGFQRDGVLRDEVFRDGRYLDMYVMAILESEWRNRTELTR